MRTKRKRPAVTWLPTNHLEVTTTGQAPVTGTGLTLVGGATGGDHKCVVFAPFDDLQYDAQGGSFPGDTALALGGEYFLRRIVGKADISILSGGSATAFALVALGFFIARVDGQGGGGVQPTTYDITFDYSPLAQQNQRMPWIWRRTWLLEQIPGVGQSETLYPASTSRYGSVLDGPHIDQKTKRRVANDERLFGALACYTMSSTDEPYGVNLLLDLRAVASLRRAHNRGTF